MTVWCYRFLCHSVCISLFTGIYFSVFNYPSVSLFRQDFTCIRKYISTIICIIIYVFIITHACTLFFLFLPFTHIQVFYTTLYFLHTHIHSWTWKQILCIILVIYHLFTNMLLWSAFLSISKLSTYWDLNNPDIKYTSLNILEKWSVPYIVSVSNC